MKYAISDIHGCLLTFKALLQDLQFSKNDTLYLLGDYIDRGPYSKEVIDYIWELQAQGYQVHCLKGNHEDMVARQAKGESISYIDLACLNSFGITSFKELPAKYADWMDALPHYFEVDNYILVHAGLECRFGNPLMDTRAMLWIRHWEQDIDKDWLGDRIVVHGHTPIEREYIENSLAFIDNLSVIDIDNGCVFNGQGLGALCAFELESKQLFFKERIDEMSFA